MPSSIFSTVSPFAPTDPLTLFLLPQFMFSPSFHPSPPSLFFFILNIQPHAVCVWCEWGSVLEEEFESFNSPE